MLDNCCKNAFTFFLNDLRFPSNSKHFMWSSAAPAARPRPRLMRTYHCLQLSQCCNRLLLARLRCLGASFGFLNAGIHRADVPSSCLRLTRRFLGAPKAARRRQLAAQTLKKLLKLLQKHSKERLGERSKPQNPPREP